MLMVKAGDSVDQTISRVLPYLEAGDIIIDAVTRCLQTLIAGPKIWLQKASCLSGPESPRREGARFGPSIMPGGNPAAWPHVKDIFQSIAAKVEDGTPCATG